jgi:hypothetical protein
MIWSSRLVRIRLKLVWLKLKHWLVIQPRIWFWSTLVLLVHGRRRLEECKQEAQLHAESNPEYRRIRAETAAVEEAMSRLRSLSTKRRYIDG